MRADVEIDDLPPRLADLANLIGLRATLSLVEHFGGIRVYVPDQLPKGHHLERLLGRQAAKKLCAYFGGAPIEVDKAEKAVRAARNREIVSKHHKVPAATLARQYGLTERNIWRIFAAAGILDDDQPDFFRSPADSSP